MVMRAIEISISVISRTVIAMSNRCCWNSNDSFLSIPIMKKVKAFKYYYKKRASTEGCLSYIGNNWFTCYQVPPRYKYLVCE